MNEIISSCKKDLLANILVSKDRIRNIFENSTSMDEAYEEKNKLYFEGWHKKNCHFKKIVKMFMDIPASMCSPISKSLMSYDLVMQRIP